MRYLVAASCVWVGLAGAARAQEPPAPAGEPASSPPAAAPAAEDAGQPQTVPASQAEWFAEYRGLVEAYSQMSQDFEAILKDYMIGEISARMEDVRKSREGVEFRLKETQAKRREEAIQAFESFIKRYERYASDPQYRP